MNRESTLGKLAVLPTIRRFPKHVTISLGRLHGLGRLQPPTHSGKLYIALLDMPLGLADPGISDPLG